MAPQSQCTQGMQITVHAPQSNRCMTPQCKTEGTKLRPSIKSLALLQGQAQCVSNAAHGPLGNARGCRCTAAALGWTIVIYTFKYLHT